MVFFDADTSKVGIGEDILETPAKTLTVKGDISASGYYYGNASNTSSFIGCVSASNFVGDGGGLTNVTATTSPAGSDTHVQFNDGGSTGGDAGFTYNKISHATDLVHINAKQKKIKSIFPASPINLEFNYNKL